MGGIRSKTTMTQHERNARIKEYLPDPLLTDNIDGVKVLTADFRFTNKNFTITVPMGYKTDFASIPKILWSILPPHGKYERAAVIHDYLCTEYGIINGEKSFTAFESADVFGFLMNILGVWKIRRFAMVWAVKLFGPRF
jgi:hypothetical protein